jgi:DNA-binding Xre family transcriptional regulator
MKDEKGAGFMVRLRVREVAEEKGISMNKLSRISDISLRTVRKMYRDPYYSATTTTLEKLANALSVKVTNLIDDGAS